jgi:hypothetical protein
MLPDDWLQFSIMDAMRGVRLPTLKRTLTEDERRELARAIFAKFRLCGFEVVTHPRAQAARALYRRHGRHRYLARRAPARENVRASVVLSAIRS